MAVGAAYMPPAQSNAPNLIERALTIAPLRLPWIYTVNPSPFCVNNA